MPLRLGQAPLKLGRIRGAVRPIVLEEIMTYFSPLSPDVPPLYQCKALVECMSWDEESDRLYLLLGSERVRIFDEACLKEIVIKRATNVLFMYSIIYMLLESRLQGLTSG